MNRQGVNLSLLLGAALFGGHAPAAWAERADRDKPIHLEADSVVVDDGRQTSTFTGSVLLTQGTLAINGDQIVVVQDKRGFKHGTATGHPAGFRQKREGLDEYVEGYGERIEYDSAGEIMNVFGQAHVKRGDDDVRGEHIIYNARTEVYKVSGGKAQRSDRVRVVIQPKGAAAASAPVAEPLSIKPDTRLPQDTQP